MPMGIVNDDEFNSEFDKLNPPKVVKPLTISPPTSPSTKFIKEVVDKGELTIDSNGKVTQRTKGRGKGNVEVPNSLRQIIGEESVTNGRQSAIELANQMGLSPSSVSAYAKGATSTATYDERPNVGHVNGVKDRITKRASSKLMMALSHISSDKLESTKARDLAGIARDMSSVIRNMEPDTDKSGQDGTGSLTKPSIVLYAPQFRDERHYDVIVVKE